MEVVSADSNGVVGIHPQQPELGATWQIHFKMACVFFWFDNLVFADLQTFLISLPDRVVV